MSCGHTPSERLLAEAEARLEHQPDSAEVYYQRVLSQTNLLAEDEAPGIRLEYAAVLLLMQIQSQATDRMRGLHIRRESYLPLLREYAEFLQPGIGARMDEAALPANKQLVVCLLCAGITDNRLIAEAAALSPDTVRIYRKDLQRFLAVE